MKISKVKKTIYVTGESTSSKRPQGESFQIWMDRTNLGTVSVFEWHTNRSQNHNRRTFALICGKTEDSWESKLCEKGFNSLELQIPTEISVELSNVSVREEIRLTINMIDTSSEICNKRFRLKSSDCDVSLLIYVSSISNGCVDAIVVEANKNCKAILREADMQNFSWELSAESSPIV